MSWRNSGIKNSGIQALKRQGKKFQIPDFRFGVYIGAGYGI